MKKLFVITGHFELDNQHVPHYITQTEAEAQQLVKHLNETEGLNIICEDDGSLANICDDDAIWYDYDEVDVINDVKTFIQLKEVTNVN